MNLKYSFVAVMVAGCVGLPLYADAPNLEEEPITQESVAILKANAEADDAEAQALLGLCYEKGTGVEKDVAKAMELYRDAAEHDSAEGQWLLGRILHQSGDSEKVREAITWLEKAANNGHGKSIMLLAKCYAEGTGVKKNTKKAVLWNTKGAEQDLIPCMIWLSLNDPDNKKRNVWLEKGAKLGDAACQYLLGLNYEVGKDVAKDADKAMYYYRQAALQGHLDALKKVGRRLAMSAMDEQNFEEAAGWLRKLITSGDDLPELKNLLGQCETELGHLEEAFKWYRQSAEQGNEWGQLKTGLKLVQGEGVEQDEEAAIFWFKKAANQGNKTAEKALQMLQ